MEVVYYIVLNLHSWLRWVVLLVLVYAIYTGVQGRMKKSRFLDKHKNIALITLIICHTQLLLGLWLYFISPIVETFLAHTKQAMSDKVLRFWGLEHAVGMILALAVITYGYTRVKKSKSERKKFTLMAVYYSIGLIIILASIPWFASSAVGRPWFRF